MCWGNHDQEDHEDVDFVDLEAQTGKQPAPPDLDRVRSGSMSGLKLTTANVAWAVGGLLLLVFALFVAYRVFDAKNSTNNGLEAEYLAWEQTRPADQQLLADQQRLADQRLAGQSGAEEQGALEEQKRLANEQATAASSIIPTGNVASYNNPPIATGAYHEEAKERQRGLTELQRKSDTLKKERVAKKQQEQKEERRKHLALTAEHRREMQKLADEQEEKEREELAATATRQSGFDSIIPTVNFSYRPIAANGFSADKEEVKEIRETEDDDEMEMDKWIKEEEKRENDVVKPRSFGVLSHPPLPQNQPRSGTGLSNQSQTQQTQPVAPLSFSYNAASSIQPVIHQTQPSPLQYSKPMNPNNDWECTKCTATNKGSDKKCMICGTPNPALPEDPEQKVVQQDEKEQSAMVTTPRPKFYSVTWNSRNGGLLSVTLDDETSEHLQNDKSKSLSLELQTESSGGVWKSVCSCPKQGLLLNLQLLKNKKVGKNLRLCMKGPNGDEVFSETKEIPDGALRRLVQHRERKDRKAKQNAHNRFGSFTRS
eukprot:58487_1